MLFVRYFQQWSTNEMIRFKINYTFNASKDTGATKTASLNFWATCSVTLRTRSLLKWMIMKLWNIYDWHLDGVKEKSQLRLLRHNTENTQSRWLSPTDIWGVTSTLVITAEHRQRRELETSIVGRARLAHSRLLHQRRRRSGDGAPTWHGRQRCRTSRPPPSTATASTSVETGRGQASPASPLVSCGQMGRSNDPQTPQKTYRNWHWLLGEVVALWL